MTAAGCVALLTLALPQQPAMFDIQEAEGVIRVSADIAAVSAAKALRGLGQALGWRVDFATPALQADLDRSSLDLSFDQRDPRNVAMLLAAAAGADVVFDQRDGAMGERTAIHVVSHPSPETDSGRERLRRRAMSWYRSFLGEDLRLDPTVVENRMEVRMHLGHMLLEQGEIEEAVHQFLRIQEEDDSHPYVPLALLRLAEGYLELGNDAQAEEWARRVSRMHPSRPETAAATVLLGRALLAQEEYDQCVDTMRSAILPLATTPEIVDILLIIAEAHRHRERPDRALDQLRTLSSSTSFDDLTREQWLDYYFLRGYASLGVGSHEEAIEALEIFLATGSADERRGEAFVMLGNTYLELGKFVEARAAALQGLSFQSELDREWRKEGRILQAKTGLALGLTDAFEDLEREVQRDPARAPELVLFLAKSFMDESRFQKAIATADLLASTPGEAGDRARYLKVLAMWRQDPQGEHLRTFVMYARAIAAEIEDHEHQQRVAELVGQAWGRMGEWEKAVDAYRGILR
ncbi:MAG: tetratricopeptide repeat protein [Planctomycetota bacterium]